MVPPLFLPKDWLDVRVKKLCLKVFGLLIVVELAHVCVSIYSYWRGSIGFSVVVFAISLLPHGSSICCSLITQTGFRLMDSDERWIKRFGSRDLAIFFLQLFFDQRCSDLQPEIHIDSLCLKLTGVFPFRVTTVFQSKHSVLSYKQNSVFIYL